ncbi:MAG: hypothetical protein NC200_07300 [Candidatus Gastranaerophilales bacterium]|nr:hypothetical protein [Candidatus Gastranaerophilales bacterium]
MAINGKILIDKIRITFPVEILSEIEHTTESYIEKTRETLGKYYPDSAYRVSKNRGELKITLTPTRFKPPHNFAYTDVNIEMPSEKWLLNLFLELGFKNRRLSETARIVWFHLTKNVIVNKPVPLYIMFLSNYPFAHKYKPACIYSSEDNTTLRIATQKRKREKEDIRGDRMIIFYDKVQELRDKANLDRITLKEPLTDEEIALLESHEVYYSKRLRRLDLNNLHLLRCEQQYRYKGKIEPLAKFLNNNTNDVLRASVLIDLLEKESLYKELNSFYVQQLKKVIFYNEPNTKEVQSRNSYQRSFLDLLQMADIKELKLIYKACGLDDKFDKNLKKFFENSMSNFYTELYEKLCR